MPQITKKLAKISNIAKGATVTIDCPTGRTYHNVQLQFEPASQAAMNNIKGIRVIANGTPVQTYASADQLDKLNKFVGRAGAITKARLFVDFDQVGVRLRPDVWATAMGTGRDFVDPESNQRDPRPVTNLQIEVDIEDTGGSDLTLTALRAKALINTNNKINTVIRYVRQFGTDIAAGVGQHDIDKLPLGDVFKRVSIDMSDRGGSAAIDYVQVQVEDFIAFDRSVNDNDSYQKDGWRIAISDWFIIDPTEDGFGGEGFVTRVGRTAIDDWRIILYKKAAATAGNARLILESQGIVPSS